MKRLLLLGSVLMISFAVFGCAGSGGAGRPLASEPPPATGERSADASRSSVPRRKSSRAAQPAPAVAPVAAVREDAAVSADSAEAGWRAALAREPGDAVALTRLSRLLHEQGRHAEAIALLTPVRDGLVKLSPADRSAALAGLALHEAALGRDGEAAAVLSLLPEGAAPGVSAFLAVRGGDADSALAATERALRTAPESAALRNNRGIALLRAGDADAASAEFERAIALDPSRPGPWYNLAILERYYRLDTAAARRRFQEYWSRSHADPDSLRAELGRSRPLPVAEGNTER